jgi:putative FmdB family regulatory protein
MPQIEYRCRKCGRDFRRTSFLGDPETAVECPACGSAEVERLKGAEAVFDGIASFSSLAGDRN